MNSLINKANKIAFRLAGRAMESDWETAYLYVTYLIHDGEIVSVKIGFCIAGRQKKRPIEAKYKFKKETGIACRVHCFVSQPMPVLKAIKSELNMHKYVISKYPQYVTGLHEYYNPLILGCDDVTELLRNAMRGEM